MNHLIIYKIFDNLGPGILYSLCFGADNSSNENSMVAALKLLLNLALKNSFSFPYPRALNIVRTVLVDANFFKDVNKQAIMLFTG